MWAGVVEKPEGDPAEWNPNFCPVGNNLFFSYTGMKVALEVSVNKNVKCFPSGILPTQTFSTVINLKHFIPIWDSFILDWDIYKGNS